MSLPEAWPGDTPLDRVSILLSRLEATLKSPTADRDDALELLGEARAVVDGLEGYMIEHSTPYPAILDDMMRATDATDWNAVGSDIPLAANMCSGGYEAAVLCMLAKMCGARRILEIGMFVGTTTIALAMLPEVDQVVTLEYVPYLLEFAAPFFERAGVRDKIDARIGAASDSLKDLGREGKQFDMIFIDADKGGYPAYFKAILDLGLLAPNGIIALDNTLYKGTPYAPHDTFADGVGPIHEVNQLIKADERVEVVILPLRDGLTIARLR